MGERKKTCRTCRAYAAKKNTNENIGQCRRRAPRIYTTDWDGPIPINPEHEAVWPEVWCEMWCCEWLKK